MILWPTLLFVVLAFISQQHDLTYIHSISDPL